MVLSDGEILDRLGEIFLPGTASPRMIGPAKYYLTLGEEGLILPGGKRYPLGQKTLTKSFTLDPGQTALVSTRERLTMPFTLSGIFGPTSTLSSTGIFFFGGMLVDPGFGRDLVDGEERENAIPLSFYLANVGADTIQLRPGEERIASIAFLHVNPPSEQSRPHYRIDPTDRRPGVRFKRELDQLFESDEAPGRVLGQVGEVSELSREVDKLKTSVNQVVLFGVILLATTLVAVVSSLIIEKSSDKPLAKSSWLDVTKAVGVVIGEIAVVVILFFLLTQAITSWLGRRRRRLGLGR
jgi:deoxycytidine triphosphate deaminase